MNRFLLILAFLLLLGVAPAHAGDCQGAIADFDQAVASLTDADPGLVAEAQGIRDEAAQMCDAGQEEGAMANIEAARTLLGL